jgi:hypothetical protein
VNQASLRYPSAIWELANEPDGPVGANVPWSVEQWLTYCKAMWIVLEGRSVISGGVNEPAYLLDALRGGLASYCTMIGWHGYKFTTGPGFRLPLPWFLTEWGINTNQVSSQSAGMRTAMLAASEGGAQGFVYYHLQDVQESPPDYFGLLDINGARKPSFTQFQQIAKSAN